MVASRRGYEHPDMRFPAKENWKGIRIIRVRSLGLGKTSKLRRALNFASYLLSCTWRLLLLPRFDVVVGMTSPPLISFLGALFVRLRGGRFVFWVMDLNPDEAIAAGWLKENSRAGRLLAALLRYSLRHAERIIVLDRFMRERIIAKQIPPERIAVIPPWSHDDAVRFDAKSGEQFRAEHGLQNKYVVMYSGNHSPCHPLDTLLEAAHRVREREEIAFCFVGGGTEYQKVKSFARAHGLKNILCLGYQPLSRLSGSLSAADLQVVVMGDAFKGIVHPCKIYNIMAVGSPLLYIGPKESHVSDIMAECAEADEMRSARHGDVETVVNHILESVSAEQRGRANCFGDLAGVYSKDVLLKRMLEVLLSSELTETSYVSPATKTKAQSA